MAITVVAGLASAGGYIASVGLAGMTLAGFASAFAVGAGLSMVSRALMPKPDLSTQLGGLETTVREPAMARQLIYGRAKVGGNIVYIDNTGDDNKYLHMVIALAGHEIDGYEKVFFNDELAWSSGAGYESKFASKTRIKFYTGNQTTADTDLVTESLQWQNNCILKDTAYIYVRLEYDTDIFSQGIPNISALVRGKKVLDPRTSTTGWSDNPALCIYDYLRDEKYGLNTQDILLQSVIDSANDCDTQVDYLDGATTRQHEKYKLNGVIDTSQKISTNIENMLTAMAGRVVFSGGNFEVHSGKYVTPTVTLDESAIVGDIQFSTKTSRRSTYNAVKGVFLSEENNYTLADYPAQVSSTYQTADGEPLFLDMTLPFTTDNVRAQRLAKLALLKSRQQRTLVVPVNLIGLKLKAGDTVYINNTKLGLSSAPYEVLDYELTYSGESLVVNLSLVETASGYYDWNTSDQIDFSIANDVALYDGTPVSVTNLTATSGVEIKTDGTTQTYIDVNWDASSDAFVDHYIIEYSNGTDKQSIKSNDTNHRISTFNDNQEYTINVYAVNLVNRKSTATQTTATSSVDILPPAQPSTFNITGELHQIKLTWSNPTDADFNRVIIKSNSTNDLETATVLSESYTNYFIDSGHLGVVTRHYWIASIDNTGNTSAYAYMGSGTTEKLQTLDFADGVIIPDYLDTSTQDTLTAVANYTSDINSLQDDINTRALQTSLDSVVNDTQRIDDTLDQASERLLQASLYMGEQVGIMRDAGITVDPDNGTVSIQAVETLRSETDAQITQIGLEIDAVEGQLGLYATRTFVENEIAQAQLDPTEFTAFTDLQVRVNDVEILADANEASLLLKASQTDLDNLEGRVTVAESDIELNAGQIELKASQSDFNTLESRVNTAEIQINAIDAPSITQTVVATRDIYNELDKNAVQTLKDVLDAYKTRQSIKRDIAFTQQEISANVLDTNEAIANARLELGAQISQNTASIINEQNIRVSETTALAEDISQLQVDVGGNTSAITEINTVSADSDSAIARSVAQLNVDVGGNTADITQINTVEATSESAIARSVAQLSVDVDNAEADIVQVNTVTADSESAIARTVYGINASITDPDTGLQANANAIDGISTDVYDTNEGLSAVGSKVSSLTATVGEEAVFEQDNQPTTGEIGDLWKKTVSGVYNGELYQFDGTNWVEKDTNFANATDSVIVKAVGETSNISSRVSTLTSTVGDNSTQLLTQQGVIDGIKGQYSVTINNNGSISGFGLVSDIIDGNPTSAFNISADQFSMTSSVTGSLWDSTTTYQIGDIVYYLGREYESKTVNSNKVPNTNTDDWDDITYIPFAVYTTDTQVTKNGETITIPRGVYIEDAFISNASITTSKIVQNAVTEQKIADLAITNAKISNLDAGKITTGFISADRIESGSIDAKIANIGWAKITDVSIVDADISNLSADKITAGTVSVDRLSIDGVTIDSNETGQLIIKGEGVDTAQLAGSAVTTPKVLDNAITVLTKTSGGSGNVTGVQGDNTITANIATLTVTTTGAPITIMAQARFSGTSSISNAIASVKRDDSFLVSLSSITYDAYSNIVTNVFYDDTVDAGTYTYTFEINTNFNGGTIYWNNVYFQILEVKK